MSDFVTVSEAAELLGVSTKTIRRWEKEGRIKSVRTEGGHRRFEVRDLLGNKGGAAEYQRVLTTPRIGGLLCQARLVERNYFRFRLWHELSQKGVDSPNQTNLFSSSRTTGFDSQRPLA